MNAHSHYFKDVSHLKEIDVYRVADLFGVYHPALQHALKKVIACGSRGAKDDRQDAQEAIDSLQRYLAMDDEDRMQGDPHFDLRATYVPGEMWQERRGPGDWQDIATRWDGRWKAAEPAFNPHHQYRKKPDMLDLPVIDSKINADKAEDRHAELRKTYREGQRWQNSWAGKDAWNDLSYGEPRWDPAMDYRRHLDCTWKEPEVEDPHAELRKIYKPGMRWRIMNNEIEGWSYWRARTPTWMSDCRYEIHPNDLPRPAEKPWVPDDSGEWVEVPDDLMGMPKELGGDEKIAVLLKMDRRRGLHCGRISQANDWKWGMKPSRDGRIVAYKVVKP